MLASVELPRTNQAALPQSNPESPTRFDFLHTLPGENQTAKACRQMAMVVGLSERLRLQLPRR